MTAYITEFIISKLFPLCISFLNFTLYITIMSAINPTMQSPPMIIHNKEGIDVMYLLGIEVLFCIR